MTEESLDIFKNGVDRTFDLKESISKVNRLHYEFEGNCNKLKSLPIFTKKQSSFLDEDFFATKDAIAALQMMSNLRKIFIHSSKLNENTRNLTSGVGLQRLRNRINMMEDLNAELEDFL